MARPNCFTSNIEIPACLEEIDEDELEAAKFFMSNINRKAYVQALCAAIADRGKVPTPALALREMGAIAVLFENSERTLRRYISEWANKRKKKADSCH